MLRIRELRESHQPRLTQEKLAVRAGVTSATVRRAERLGRANSDTLQAIALALGVDIGELFESREEAS